MRNDFADVAKILQGIEKVGGHFWTTTQPYYLFIIQAKYCSLLIIRSVAAVALLLWVDKWTDGL